MGRDVTDRPPSGTICSCAGRSTPPSRQASRRPSTDCGSTSYGTPTPRWRSGRGWYPDTLKRHMGHSSTTTTMDRYGHMHALTHKETANALDALQAKPRDRWPQANSA